MGRHRIEREKRKVSTCFTLSPKTIDILNEMADSKDMAMSAVVEECILNEYETRLNAIGQTEENGSK